MKELIITMPDYPTHVETSKAQRAQYYFYNGVTIKAKSKKLLFKYINPEFKEVVKASDRKFVSYHYLHKDYCLLVFKDKDKKPIDTIVSTTDLASDCIYFSERYKILLANRHTQELEIANSTQVGKPKLTRINFQDLWTGNMNGFTRRKVAQAIKIFMLPFVRDLPIIEGFPLLVEMYVFDHPANWDLGNKAIWYGKTFLDLLVTGKTGELKEGTKPKDKDYIQYFQPKIPDDSIKYVTADPSGGIFRPILEHETRKLVFRIRKDTNPRFNKHPYYKS